MQHLRNELLRIHLPRTRVNRGKRKGRGSAPPAQALFFLREGISTPAMAHSLVGSVECAVSTATAAGSLGTVTTEASAALAEATASGLGTRFGVVNCVSTATAAATGLPTAFYGTAAATVAAPSKRWCFRLYT
jgi:hypothetical protein